MCGRIRKQREREPKRKKKGEAKYGRRAETGEKEF
jgi:hypothetical protein